MLKIVTDTAERGPTFAKYLTEVGWFVATTLRSSGGRDRFLHVLCHELVEVLPVDVLVLLQEGPAAWCFAKLRVSFANCCRARSRVYRSRFLQVYRKL